MNKIELTQNDHTLPHSPQFVIMYKKLLGRKLTPKEIKLLRVLKAKIRKEMNEAGN